MEYIQISILIGFIFHRIYYLQIFFAFCLYILSLASVSPYQIMKSWEEEICVCFAH